MRNGYAKVGIRSRAELARRMGTES
ncbi:hypothetical protein [Pseudonocardia sp. GCM10023141]